MLLDDGQMYINEALTPSQRNQLFQDLLENTATL
jgi:hypothetical protein